MGNHLFFFKKDRVEPKFKHLYGERVFLKKFLDINYNLVEIYKASNNSVRKAGVSVVLDKVSKWHYTTITAFKDNLEVKFNAKMAETLIKFTQGMFHNLGSYRIDEDYIPASAFKAYSDVTIPPGTSYLIYNSFADKMIKLDVISVEQLHKENSETLKLNKNEENSYLVYQMKIKIINSIIGESKLESYESLLGDFRLCLFDFILNDKIEDDIKKINYDFVLDKIRMATKYTPFLYGAKIKQLNE